MVIMTWQYGSRTWIRISSETAGISSKMMGYPPAGLSPALYQAIVQEGMGMRGISTSCMKCVCVVVVVVEFTNKLNLLQLKKIACIFV